MILLVNGFGTFVLLNTLVPSVNGLPFLLGTVFTALVCTLIGKLQKNSSAVTLVVSIAAGAGLFAFFRYVMEGFRMIWNQIAQVLGSKAGIYLNMYQQNTSSVYAEISFLIFLGIAWWAFIGFVTLKAAVNICCPPFCSECSRRLW